MAVSPLKTSSYARSIIYFGTQSFSSIPAEYIVPCKQYAADKYYIDDIEYALNHNWITQQEFDDIMALKTPESPQHPPIVASSPESI